MAETPDRRRRRRLGSDTSRRGHRGPARRRSGSHRLDERTCPRRARGGCRRGDPNRRPLERERGWGVRPLRSRSRIREHRGSIERWRRRLRHPRQAEHHGTDGCFQGGPADQAWLIPGAQLPARRGGRTERPSFPTRRYQRAIGRTVAGQLQRLVRRPAQKAQRSRRRAAESFD